VLDIDRVPQYVVVQKFFMVDPADTQNQINIGKRALAMCVEWVQATQTALFTPPNHFRGFWVNFDHSEKKAYKEYIPRLGFVERDTSTRSDKTLDWAFHVFQP
jgi:hypothetical protein